MEIANAYGAPILWFGCLASMGSIMMQIESFESATDDSVRNHPVKVMKFGSAPVEISRS